MTDDEMYVGYEKDMAKAIKNITNIIIILIILTFQKKIKNSYLILWIDIQE